MKFLLAIAVTFVIGLSAGLAYAWLIDPVTYSESSPALVSRSYRETWLLMAAQAYAQDSDWARTQVRLEALRPLGEGQLAKMFADLFEQAQQHGAKTQARALAELADRLGVRTAAMIVYLATPQVTPTPEPAAPVVTQRATTAQATATQPRPTATPEPAPTFPPTSTPVPAYRVVEQVSDCSAPPQAPQIRVFVRDNTGQGVTGKEVWITWEGGADRFFTGLKPEIDPGYGDFEMAADQAYNVGLDKSSSIVVAGLRAEPCAGEGRTSWQLVLESVTPE